MWILGLKGYLRPLLYREKLVLVKGSPSLPPVNFSERLFENNLRLSSFVEERRNPCSGPLPVYQDLSTCNCYDWPVKKPLSIWQSG